jgi:DNA recombination protein RmuC
MDLNSPVLQIADRSFSLLEVALAAAGLGLFLLLLAVILAFRAQAGRKAERAETQRRTADMEYRLAELSGALQGFATQSQSNQIHLQRVIDERLDMVSSRVGHGLTEQTEKTTQSLLQLGERLAVIDAAQKNLTSLSTEMISSRTFSTTSSHAAPMARAAWKRSSVTISTPGPSPFKRHSQMACGPTV